MLANPTVELVIARYQEDVAWAEELGVPGTVYNKGHYLEVSDPCAIVPLSNVGREAHSYLAHITHRWNALADWTVFCQADPQPHLAGVDIRHLLRPIDGFRVPWRCGPIREWGDDGRLRWADWPSWAGRYASGEIEPSPLTLVEYFRLMLSVDLAARRQLSYHPGAIFGVSRAAIHRRPLDFYSSLLRSVEHCIHPEEAHYLERAWPLIFCPDGKGW